MILFTDSFKDPTLNRWFFISDAGGQVEVLRGQLRVAVANPTPASQAWIYHFMDRFNSNPAPSQQAMNMVFGFQLTILEEFAQEATMFFQTNTGNYFTNLVFGFTPDRHIWMYSTDVGDFVAYSTKTLELNTPYYIEVKVSCTGRFVEIHVDGKRFMKMSDLNLMAPGEMISYLDFSLGEFSTDYKYSYIYDNVYALDGLDGYTDFLGPNYFCTPDITARAIPVQCNAVLLSKEGILVPRC